MSETPTPEQSSLVAVSYTHLDVYKRQDVELLNLPTETLLTRLFHEEDVRLFEASTTQFYCSCSRESVANMLRLLGSEEITSLIEERGNIEVHCDFCNKLYAFDQIDAAQLMIAEAVIATSKKIH